MSLDPAVPEVKIIAQCEDRPPISPGTAGSPICGIYGIWCEANEKWYIGQSVDILGRWRAHHRDLEKGTHSNKVLQRAWDKHGPSSFSWVVLGAICLEELLDLAEISAVDELQALSPIGFNLKSGGANGRPSLEARLKMSLARKKVKVGPPSAAKREKISASLRGRKYSAERIARSSEGKLRRYLGLRLENSVPAGHKKCGRCKGTKANSLFQYDRQNIDRLSSWCRDCINLRRRERRAEKARA